jgi:NAD-dependent SIR2 family protein deacetylase
MGPGNPIGRIEKKDLPKCPQCPLGLQRPDVVWFGEKLDINLVRRADNFVDQEPLVSSNYSVCPQCSDSWLTPIAQDMMLVIGTSALVWPAAGYIGRARGQGARIVTIDLTAEDPEQMAKMEPGDLMFAGDASELLPLLLEPVIGKMQTDGTFVEE